MREIKFRGKRVDNGEWVYGDIIHSAWKTFIKDCNDKYTNPRRLAENTADFRCIEVAPSTVGQYTGLKDSKRTEEYPEGQEIYEGDIIKAVALANDHNQRGAITISAVEYWMGNACLSITHVPLYPFIVNHSFEVIGNVWEDGDLLNDC